MYVVVGGTGRGTGGLSAVTPLRTFATSSKQPCVGGPGYMTGEKISPARDVDELESD